jgi:hypothetical protein
VLVSLNECTEHLVDRTVIVFGLCDWGHVAIFCFMCVGLPHCPHCVAQLFFRCTVTLTPSVYKTEYSNVFVFGDKTVGQQYGGGEIEIYRNGVR